MACAALALVCSLLDVSLAKDRSKDGERLSTPQEILGRLERSKTAYVVTSTAPGDLGDLRVERFGELLWPEGKSLAAPRVVRDADGNARLKEDTAPKQAWSLLRQADALFAREKYAEALARYAELLGRFPEFSKAWLYLGDVHFAGKRYQDALVAYTKGIELNPVAYEGHLFKGHALFKLGRRDEALDEWVRTLALRPRQPTAMKLLVQYADLLGIDVHDERFEPQAFVRKEENAIRVYTPANPPWIAWANCKALWLGESSYRKEKTGKSERTFDPAEEWECLANLYAIRATDAQVGRAQPDPVLDRVARIGDDKMLIQMLTYDVVSRALPDALLLLGDEERKDLEAYIRRYVIPRRGLRT